MSGVRSRFETLRWRLILSYFVTVLVGMLTLEVAFVVAPAIISLVTLRAPTRPTALTQRLDQLAPEVVPYLSQTPPDRQGLVAWMRAPKEPIRFDGAPGPDISRSFNLVPGQTTLLLAVDRTGQVVATYGPTSAGALTGVADTREAHAVIETALLSPSDRDGLLATTPDGRSVAAAPVRDAQGHVLGALFLAADIPAVEAANVWSGLSALLLSIIPFGIIASILGAIVGQWTARSLTRRLRGLTDAANAWSHGDFSTYAHDPSRDELGRLARDLNSMAEQIQTLLASRKELAVVEERNRLARDLHDSVKQELFAASMQVAAARALVQRDPAAAEARLDGMERLLSQAKRELTTLIHELRPAALAGTGLVSALRDYCADWSHDSGIVAEVRAQAEQPVSLEIEQALFRVAQEALANVVRHSEATRVEVLIAWDPHALTLMVTDDGKGFEVAAAHGKGIGLHSIEERVAAMGGALSIRRAIAGRGTSVEVCVPLPGQTSLATPPLSEVASTADHA